MLDEGQFASSSGRCEAGDQVIIDYVGRLKENEYEFDRSNGPFTFTLGYGEVIAGMERGVLGMKTDETRRVTVPPKLGYGKRGDPPDIPGDSTLVFDVTMLRFEPVTGE